MNGRAFRKSLKASAMLFALAVFLDYFLFSPTGLLVRLKLWESQTKLSELTERLEREKEDLRQKYQLLQNDTIALEMQAKKYLILEDDSHILRFREPSAANSPNGEKTPKPATLEKTAPPENEENYYDAVEAAANEHLPWRIAFAALAIVGTGYFGAWVYRRES